MIDREALVEMFENIADQGEWGMSKPMLWGYFFTNSDQDALRDAVPVELPRFRGQVSVLVL